MSRLRRLLLAIPLAVAVSLCSNPDVRAKTLQPGDILTIGVSIADPSQNFVLRISPTTGFVDTIVALPAPVRAIAVAPQDCFIYLLGVSAIYRVDPCAGTVSTLTASGISLVVPQSDILVHTNGSLYWTKGNGPIVRTDRFTGTHSEITNTITTHSVGPGGLTEGDDHQLYVATASSSAVPPPWVLKVDPNSGASSVYAKSSFGGASNSNVRHVAFDTRDSLFVYRIGFTHIVDRTDPVAQLAGPLLTLPNISGANYGFTGHPDGGLYYINVVPPTLIGVSRVDPVTQAVSVVVPLQSAFNFGRLALVRTESSCPSDARRSTWGKVKALYR